MMCSANHCLMLAGAIAALIPVSSGAANRNISGDWWSLKPIVRGEVPRKTGSPIDAFIDAKLAEKGMTRSPEADRRTLIRRLSFDLTGLPPTPKEVDAFAANNDPQAWEALVDKLLDSPRYGERWARHWLDVVHFGETHGYDKDRPRPNAWPYRDYVIRALNEDKPYARFVQEQIAGDVLFPGTRDGLEALGFIAAGPWDVICQQEVSETKIDGKIARHLDRDDMVQNAMLTFTSLTVGCAQCHDHKFDPISQEDYYCLQAVFAALDRTEVKYFADDAQNRRFRELERARNQALSAISTLEKPLREKAGGRYAELSRKIENSSKSAANAKPEYGWHSALSPTQDAEKWVQIDLGSRTTIDRIALQPCYDDFNAIGAGFGFPLRFKVEASDDTDFKSGVEQFWQRHDETFMRDFANPGLRPFITKSGNSGIAGRYVRVTAVKLAPRKNDFIFALAEVQVLDAAGNNLALGKPVSASDSIDAAPRWRKTNITDGIFPTAASGDHHPDLINQRDALLLSFADDSTRQQLAKLRQQVNAADTGLRTLPAPSLVYAGAVHTGSGNFRGTGADGGKPREIRILNRGDVMQPGNVVGPGALSAVTGLPARFDLHKGHSEGERRAALAQWLTNPHQPLTWRSIVNRVWQHHFGRGLVDTANDFGRNGTKPSHPELLDWLASEFRDGGGSLKKLHKLIVMSETYRQTSAERADFSKLDSDNVYLSHMNRRKLDAETMRDSVLLVSGQLDLTMGGPSFQDFVVNQPENSPHYEYHLHDPDDPAARRRSIYRFIVRSQLQPFMTALDCADPSMQVDKRNQSLSPLQALALMNNGFMVTMSKHFAESVDKVRGGVEPKILLAFQRALGRVPTADEQRAFDSYAKEFGMANACRALFNLNEFAFAD